MESISCQRNSNVVVVIPAYNPPSFLIDLTKQLLDLGLRSIIVVDDGSSSDYDNVFTALKNNHIIVISHTKNQGKGTALKSAFDFCLKNFNHVTGVVTADADGQHSPEDVLRVADVLNGKKKELILGARAFDVNVPLRSKAGNFITKKTFRFITGQKISDTQTGLRGIPRAMLESLVALPGERYEYEMNMLLAIKNFGMQIKEIPINTIYIDQNKSSHFNPLKDSFKIYFLLARFISSSLLSAVADYIIFLSIYWLTQSSVRAVYGARLISSGINFTFNRSLVFKSNKNIMREVFYYCLLVVVTAGCSLGLMHIVVAYVGVGIWFAKFFADIILFPVVFYLQRDFVFKTKNCNEGL